MGAIFIFQISSFCEKVDGSLTSYGLILATSAIYQNCKALKGRQNELNTDGNDSEFIKWEPFLVFKFSYFVKKLMDH